MIFSELSWVPGQLSQAEDRTHRIGQAESVLIQHLVLDGSIDARMAQVVTEKQAIIDRALDDETKNEIAQTPIVIGEEMATQSASRARIIAEAELLTPAEIATIHAQLRTLSAMCDGARTIDGAGFSKMDVRIGKSLANALTLTPKQAALGKRLCTRYKRQLG